MRLQLGRSWSAAAAAEKITRAPVADPCGRGLLALLNRQPRLRETLAASAIGGRTSHFPRRCRFSRTNYAVIMFVERSLNPKITFEYQE